MVSHSKSYQVTKSVEDNVEQSWRTTLESSGVPASSSSGATTPSSRTPKLPLAITNAGEKEPAEEPNEEPPTKRKKVGGKGKDGAGQEQGKNKGKHKGKDNTEPGGEPNVKKTRKEGSDVTIQTAIRKTYRA